MQPLMRLPKTVHGWLSSSQKDLGDKDYPRIPHPTQSDFFLEPSSSPISYAEWNINGNSTLPDDMHTAVETAFSERNEKPQYVRYNLFGCIALIAAFSPQNFYERTGTQPTLQHLINCGFNLYYPTLPVIVTEGKSHLVSDTSANDEYTVRDRDILYGEIERSLPVIPKTRATPREMILMSIAHGYFHNSLRIQDPQIPEVLHHPTPVHIIAHTYQQLGLAGLNMLLNSSNRLQSPFGRQLEGEYRIWESTDSDRQLQPERAYKLSLSLALNIIANSPANKMEINPVTPVIIPPVPKNSELKDLRAWEKSGYQSMTPDKLNSMRASIVKHFPLFSELPLGMQAFEEFLAQLPSHVKEGRMYDLGTLSLQVRSWVESVKGYCDLQSRLYPNDEQMQLQIQRIRDEIQVKSIRYSEHLAYFNAYPGVIRKLGVRRGDIPPFHTFLRSRQK